MLKNRFWDSIRLIIFLGGVKMGKGFFRNKVVDKDNLDKENLESVLQKAKKSSDFTSFSLSSSRGEIIISYYSSLIETEVMKRDFLPYIKPHTKHIKTLEELAHYIPIDHLVITNNTLEITNKLNNGYAIIQLNKNDSNGLLVNLNSISPGLRLTNDTENEFSVIGPKIGFIENIDTNIYLLRQKIATSSLIFEEITVGSMSKTKVMIAYIDGVTNPQYVNTVRQRIRDIDIDIIYDVSIIDQIISDNSTSPFPLLLSTERVDRVVYALSTGQVGIFSDGSPYVVTGPSTLLDFFISPEDYYLPWVVGSFFRMIRIFGVTLSILFTPLYVAVLTFHYEVIPQNLLGPLVSSRMNVPFPPIVEVIFLELTIEFLREAGGRLPSKIGQTLGIVGGIVIGQAAVEAALTSNILLIIIALSALASFTTPIYKMSVTIRIIRFPLILLAAIWGGLGIVLGLVIILIHLLKLKSLGNPYLAPMFPFRPKDFSDSVIRTSLQYATKRPGYLRTLLTSRYHPKKNKDPKEGINNE